MELAEDDTNRVGAISSSSGINGVMMALKPPRLDFVPLQDATAKLEFVPPDCESVLVARTLDITFGNEGDEPPSQNP
jgi:hypothetical protein